MEVRLAMGQHSRLHHAKALLGAHVCIFLQFNRIPSWQQDFLEDCQWAPWDAWSSCDDSCGARDGTGAQTRTREIGIGETDGGTPCNAAVDGTDTQLCSVACPGSIIIQGFWVKEGLSCLPRRGNDELFDFLLPPTVSYCLAVEHSEPQHAT